MSAQIGLRTGTFDEIFFDLLIDLMAKFNLQATK